MASITAAEFKAIINDSVISATNAEYIIDVAVDVLNLFGDAEIANMSGTAGSKTWGGDSRQKGAIFLVARTIYNDFYIGVDAENVDVTTLSATNLLGNPTILKTIMEAARRLSEMEVDVG